MFRLPTRNKGLSLNLHSLVLAFSLAASQNGGVAFATPSATSADLPHLLEQQGWQAQTRPDGSTVYLPPPQRVGQSTDEQPDANTPPTSADSYQKLRDSGWEVRKDSEGNTLLIPPKQQTAAPAERDEPAPSEPPATTSAGTPAAGTATTLPEIRRLLIERGWRLETDSVGNTILLPAQAGTVAPRASGSGNTLPGVNDVKAEQTASPFSQFQQSLRQKGWHVESAADGAVLVYPPAALENEEGHAANASATRRGHCAGIESPAVSEGEIQLPIDTHNKAEQVARDWIAHFGTAQQLVGRIRHINHFYAVSIVDGTPPYRLRNQVLSRTENGRLIAIR